MTDTSHELCVYTEPCVDQTVPSQAQVFDSYLHIKGLNKSTIITLSIGIDRSEQ